MKLEAQAAGATQEIVVEPSAGGWRVVIDGVAREVEIQPIRPGSYWLRFADGRSITVDVDPAKDGDWLVESRGVSFPVKLLDHRKKLLAAAQAQRAQQGATGPTVVRAPMPGKVVKLLCKPGETIAAGAGLIVVEAMKMENELRSPREGVVQTVHVKEGQAVEGQEPLVTLT
jgi:glutaconyl-CoA/methylmalonyl-CoA decarboxylase subunit gamma